MQKGPWHPTGREAQESIASFEGGIDGFADIPRQGLEMADVGRARDHRGADFQPFRAMQSISTWPP